MNKSSDYTNYHPFQKMYWIAATKKMKETKSIVLASILTSMMIVVNVLGTSLNLEILGSKVYFEFIPAAICSMLLGPVLGMLAGATSDIIGFLINPGGYTFFLGYTISAVLSSLIYALFLHNTRISVFKILVAKFIVNMIVNVLIGTLWYVILFLSINLYWEKASLSFIKNISLLPFEVAILALLIRYLLPVSKAYNLVPKDIPNEVRFF